MIPFETYLVGSAERVRKRSNHHYSSSGSSSSTSTTENKTNTKQTSSKSTKGRGRKEKKTSKKKSSSSSSKGNDTSSASNSNKSRNISPDLQNIFADVHPSLLLTCLDVMNSLLFVGTVQQEETILKQQEADLHRIRSSLYKKKNKNTNETTTTTTNAAVGAGSNMNNLLQTTTAMNFIPRYIDQIALLVDPAVLCSTRAGMPPPEFDLPQQLSVEGLERYHTTHVDQRGRDEGYGPVSSIELSYDIVFSFCDLLQRMLLLFPRPLVKTYDVKNLGLTMNLGPRPNGNQFPRGQKGKRDVGYRDFYWQVDNAIAYQLRRCLETQDVNYRENQQKSSSYGGSNASGSSATGKSSSSSTSKSGMKSTSDQKSSTAKKSSSIRPMSNADYQVLVSQLKKAKVAATKAEKSYMEAVKLNQFSQLQLEAYRQEAKSAMARAQQLSEMVSRQQQQQLAMRPGTCRAWASIKLLERMSRVDINTLSLHLDRLVHIVMMLAKTDTSINALSRGGSGKKGSSGSSSTHPSKRAKFAKWRMSTGSIELERRWSSSNVKLHKDRDAHLMYLWKRKRHLYRRQRSLRGGMEYGSGGRLSQDGRTIHGDSAAAQNLNRATYATPSSHLLSATLPGQEASSLFTDNNKSHMMPSNMIPITENIDMQHIEDSPIRINFNTGSSSPLPLPTEAGDSLATLLILMGRVAHTLTVERKQFFQALVYIIERSLDLKVLGIVVELLAKWILIPLGPREEAPQGLYTYDGNERGYGDHVEDEDWWTELPPAPSTSHRSTKGSDKSSSVNKKKDSKSPSSKSKKGQLPPQYRRAPNAVLNEKEKQIFLVRMQALERFRLRGDALPLLSAYYDIIYRLHALPDTRRPAWVQVHLRRPFIAALMSPNALQRRDFFHLFLHRAANHSTSALYRKPASPEAKLAASTPVPVLLRASMNKVRQRKKGNKQSKQQTKAPSTSSTTKYTGLKKIEIEITKLERERKENEELQKLQMNADSVQAHVDHMVKSQQRLVPVGKGLDALTQGQVHLVQSAHALNRNAAHVEHATPAMVMNMSEETLSVLSRKSSPSSIASLAPEQQLINLEKAALSNSVANMVQVKTAHFSSSKSEMGTELVEVERSLAENAPIYYYQHQYYVNYTSYSQFSHHFMKQFRNQKSKVYPEGLARTSVVDVDSKTSTSLSGVKRFSSDMDEDNDFRDQETLSLLNRGYAVHPHMRDEKFQAAEHSISASYRDMQGYASMRNEFTPDFFDQFGQWHGHCLRMKAEQRKIASTRAKSVLQKQRKGKTSYSSSLALDDHQDLSGRPIRNRVIREPDQGPLDKYEDAYRRKKVKTDPTVTGSSENSKNLQAGNTAGGLQNSTSTTTSITTSSTAGGTEAQGMQIEQPSLSTNSSGGLTVTSMKGPAAIPQRTAPVSVNTPTTLPSISTTKPASLASQTPVNSSLSTEGRPNLSSSKTVTTQSTSTNEKEKEISTHVRTLKGTKMNASNIDFTPLRYTELTSRTTLASDTAVEEIHRLAAADPLAMYALREFRGPFSRLFVILTQDWDPVSSRFWLRVSTDILVSALDHRVRTNQWRHRSQLFPSRKNYSNTTRRRYKPDKRSGNGNMARVVIQERESAFLSFIEAQTYTGNLMEPLCELAHTSTSIATQLWLQGFQIAWQALSAEEQAALVTPMITLLSSPYHYRQLQIPAAAGYRLNVIQVLLKACAVSRPTPRLPSELVHWLGKTFNAWNIAASICEVHLLEDAKGEAEDGSEDTTTGETFKYRQRKERENWVKSLSDLYSKLNENDMYLGIMRQFCQQKDSLRAISAMAHHEWSSAQDYIGGAMKAVYTDELDDAYDEVMQSTLNSNKNSGVDDTRSDIFSDNGMFGAAGAAATMSRDDNDKNKDCKVPLVELEFLENSWLTSAKELAQWETLGRHACNTRDAALLLECAWKTSQWEHVRRILRSEALSEMHCNGGSDGSSSSSSSSSHQSFGMSTTLASDITQRKLMQIYVAMHDGKIDEVEALCSYGNQLALRRWCALPLLGSKAHIPVLQLFQQLVELQESAQIMVEMNTKSQQHTLPDLKSILSTWRERLPNPCDSMLVWENLLMWRKHVFTSITDMFNMDKSAPALAMLHDTPWTMLVLAKIARKKKLEEVAIYALNQLAGLSTMDVQDAFEKLREQILLCLGAAEQKCDHVAAISFSNCEVPQGVRQSRVGRPEVSLEKTLQQLRVIESGGGNSSGTIANLITGNTGGVIVTKPSASSSINFTPPPSSLGLSLDFGLNEISQLKQTGDGIDFLTSLSRLHCYHLVGEARKREMLNGLYIINNTNLDYFRPEQKAELFRLKAIFLKEVGEDTNTITYAFNQAVNICEGYGKTYLSWARYFDNLFEQEKDKLEQVESERSLLNRRYKEVSESVRKFKERQKNASNPTSSSTTMAENLTQKSNTEAVDNTNALSKERGILLNQQLKEVSNDANRLDREKKRKKSNMLSFAVQAMSCYLQAVNYRRSAGARMVLARVLWLLSYDEVIDENSPDEVDDDASYQTLKQHLRSLRGNAILPYPTGVLASTFEKYVEQTPMWSWILWIPQLLSNLARPEGAQMSAILLGLANMFPQALYYTLRAFLLEKREIPQDPAPSHPPAPLFKPRKSPPRQQSTTSTRSESTSKSKTVITVTDDKKDQGGQINKVPSTTNGGGGNTNTAAATATKSSESSGSKTTTEKKEKDVIKLDVATILCATKKQKQDTIAQQGLTSVLPVCSAGNMLKVIKQAMDVSYNEIHGLNSQKAEKEVQEQIQKVEDALRLKNEKKKNRTGASDGGSIMTKQQRSAVREYVQTIHQNRQMRLQIMIENEAIYQGARVLTEPEIQGVVETFREKLRQKEKSKKSDEEIQGMAKTKS
eukprot:g3007.t1